MLERPPFDLAPCILHTHDSRRLSFIPLDIPAPSSLVPVRSSRHIPPKVNRHTCNFAYFPSFPLIPLRGSRSTQRRRYRALHLAIVATGRSLGFGAHHGKYQMGGFFGAALHIEADLHGATYSHLVFTFLGSPFSRDIGISPPPVSHHIMLYFPSVTQNGTRAGALKYGRLGKFSVYLLVGCLHIDLFWYTLVPSIARALYILILVVGAVASCPRGLRARIVLISCIG